MITPLNDPFSSVQVCTDKYIAEQKPLWKIFHTNDNVKPLRCHQACDNVLNDAFSWILVTNVIVSFSPLTGFVDVSGALNYSEITTIKQKPPTGCGVGFPPSSGRSQYWTFLSLGQRVCHFTELQRGVVKRLLGVCVDKDEFFGERKGLFRTIWLFSRAKERWPNSAVLLAAGARVCRQTHSVSKLPHSSLLFQRKGSSEL